MKQQHYPLVKHLEALAKARDRGALAKLRRGLGKAPGEAAEMLPYVVPYLPADGQSQNAFFLVASLFGLHPSPGSTGNIGAVYRRLGDHESVEKRFVAMLNCHPDELGDHLRHAVNLLKSKEIPIDYHRLLRDLLYWSHPVRFVQLDWAKAYWAAGHENQNGTDSTEDKPSSHEKGD